MDACGTSNSGLENIQKINEDDNSVLPRGVHGSIWRKNKKGLGQAGGGEEREEEGGGGEDAWRTVTPLT